MAAARVGIDIGGTFTDLAAVDLESGEARQLKAPSTPPDLAEGAAAALNTLAATLAMEAITFLAHGTTAGTNALIEGTGARTALLTTEGFRDLLDIARQKRPSLYDLRARKPRPLVPRWLRREVPERVQFDGTVLRELDLDAARRELATLENDGMESLAICFLHSYANPSHERAVRELAQQLLPNAYVTASSDLLPRFREYERLSTTVINAYLGPLMNRYLDELSARSEGAGVAAPVHIMQSSGGLALPEEARTRPAATVLSGPAAGAAAAADLCSQVGLERAISIDMGGTSTDVCIVEGGLPAVAPGRDVGGYAIELPGVDVRCIGAGGGSILAVDPGGMPQVGPQSAGADPGPVCYGRGGEEPTLTDALLVLGRLDPAGLLGGDMPLDIGASRQSILARVAGMLGVTVERAAMGAVELAVTNVLRAVEAMTVARGRDPRDFVLVAAGGAGPLIACELASELDIEQVVIPPWPGSFSACGLLASELRRDWTRTCLVRAIGDGLREISDEFGEIEREARAWLSDVSSPGSRLLLLRAVAARYVGQDYELDVAVPPEELTEEGLAQVVAGFHEAHQRRYGYDLPNRPVEFVNLSVTAVQRLAPESRGRPRCAPAAGDGAPGVRLVYLGGRAGCVECPVYDRGALGPGDSLAGPAIIQQYDTTTYLPPGFGARVDGQANLRLRARER